MFIQLFGEEEGGAKQKRGRVKSIQLECLSNKEIAPLSTVNPASVQFPFSCSPN